MRKVVINGDYLAFKTFAGVSRFATELLREMDKMVQDLDVELLTPEYVQNIPDFININVVKHGRQPIMRWKHFLLPSYIKDNDALMVDLTQAFPLGMRGITCIHDCIPELIPNSYHGFIGKYVRRPIKLLQRRIVAKNSVAILTVSNYSNKDIIRLYHVDKDKVTTVYNAWQHIERVVCDDKIFQKYPILEDKEYFFTLGSRVQHKNLQWIIAAAQQNSNVTFVVSGENSYSHNFSHEKSTLMENIIFTGYLSDGEIKSLMSKCKAFILPSFYEGFGIPPLEALAVGSKIIVSNAACLPEVYGKSAHYIDPYNYDNINLDEILLTQVDSPDETLERFSWNKSAKVLYETIIKQLD